MPDEANETAIWAAAYGTAFAQCIDRMGDTDAACEAVTTANRAVRAYRRLMTAPGFYIPVILPDYGERYEAETRRRREPTKGGPTDAA